MRSTSQVRTLYSPPCESKNRGNGFLDAWVALDKIMHSYNYHPRSGETFAYNCRRITGGTGYSLHAYLDGRRFTFWTGVSITLAVACDINSRSNPYGSRLITDMPRPMVDAICAIRTNNGVQVFRWGGYYSGNKDAMHYEVVASPAELETGINWNTVRLKASPAPVFQPQESEDDDDMKPFIVHVDTGAACLVLGDSIMWIPDVASYENLQRVFGAPVEISAQMFEQLKKGLNGDVRDDPPA